MEFEGYARLAARPWHVRFFFRAYRQLHRFHDLCQVGWTPKSHNLMPWLGSQWGPVTGAAKQAFYSAGSARNLHGRTNHCSLLWVLQMLILHSINSWPNNTAVQRFRRQQPRSEVFVENHVQSMDPFRIPCGDYPKKGPVVKTIRNDAKDDGFFGRHFGFDSTCWRKPPFLWSVGPVVSMELLKEEATPSYSNPTCTIY